MRDTVEPTTNEYGFEVHPAWAMMGMSRISSTPGSVLFDSDIRHGNSVIVRLHLAERKRDLNRDYKHATKLLYEVEMSEAQWASFVSSANTGDGVPVTLKFKQGDGHIPGMPYDPRLRQSMKETHDAAEAAFRDIREALAVYEAHKTKDTLSTLRAVINNATPNVDFAGKSLAEHTENVVQKARADLEAIVLNKAQQLGIEPGEAVHLVELPSVGDDDA